MIFFRKLQQNNGLIVQWNGHGGQSVWKCGRCVSICADSQSWRGKTVEIGTHFFCAINYICCKSSINSENAKDWTWVKKIFNNCALSSWVNHWTLQVWFGASHVSVVIKNYSFRPLDMFTRISRHCTVLMIKECLILSKSLSEVFEKKIKMKDRVNVHCTDLN